MLVMKLIASTFELELRLNLKSGCFSESSTVSTTSGPVCSLSGIGENKAETVPIDLDAVEYNQR